MPQLPSLQLLPAQTADPAICIQNNIFWLTNPTKVPWSFLSLRIIGWQHLCLSWLPSKTLLDEQEFFLRIFVFVDFRFVKSTQIPEGDLNLVEDVKICHFPLSVGDQGCILRVVIFGQLSSDDAPTVVGSKFAIICKLRRKPQLSLPPNYCKSPPSLPGTARFVPQNYNFYFFATIPRKPALNYES